MNKAFSFRLYPNDEQEVLIQKTFGCVRFVYNKMLAEKIAYYEETKKSLMVTPAKYKEEYPFLKEVDSIALCNGQLNLETAYRNFFRDKKVGFPHYKSKKNDRKSYTTNRINTNIRLEEGCIVLPKLGKVKIKQHRPIPNDYKLKSATISQKASGKYFVSILYEYEETVPLVKAENVIGLDFSMAELYIDSNGMSPEYPRYYRLAQEKLARMQRTLSQMQKCSSNYYKQKRKVSRLHEHIANQRNDFLHKQSRRITNAYDCVMVEDLNMKAMSQALHFGKSVHDNGWGMFMNFLHYKLTEQGKQLVKVDKWFPSSKVCSVCGAKKVELSLSERTYICECGSILSRDHNAAINIKNEGLRLLAIAYY